MAGNDHIGLPDPSARKGLSRVPELVEALATVVPVRGTRLHHLAQTIASNVERDLFENDLDHRDSEVRRLVLAQHVQLLRDALDGSGAFAGEPAALLSLRWADRAAFEAYAKLHARLCPPGFECRPDTRTIQDMLLALRLRMARLDWESIAELLESLGRSCEETALRKRQSRLASMAVVAGCARQWRTIDGYLKAKRRSYGGTPRKYPLMPLAVLFFVLVALTAAAWVFFQSSTPMSPGSADPSSPEEQPLPSTVPKRPVESPQPLRHTELSPSLPSTQAQSEILGPTPNRPLVTSPDGVQHKRGETLGGVEVFYTFYLRAAGGPLCEVVERTRILADDGAVLNALTNVSDYPQWMELITRVESTATEAREGEQSAVLFRADLRNRVNRAVDTVWRVAADGKGRVIWSPASDLMPTRRGVTRLDGGSLHWHIEREDASHTIVKLSVIFRAPNGGVKELESCEASTLQATAYALKDYVEQHRESLPK